jgi:RNA polymerase sigma-70 factor (ECF subfamily)
MSRNNEPSDADLVARVLAGDRDAFGCLYDRYARLVRAVVYRFGINAQLIHDLTQECFLRAYRNLARLRQPDRFGPWVVGIARAVAREHRRASRRDRHQFVAGNALEVWSDPDTPGALQTADEIEVVLRSVCDLPERERMAIHAFFLQERDAEEAARLLNLSRSGIYALLGRALAHLADSVGRGASRKV